MYSRSYVVHGQNIWRTEREAVHNHGHQLEAMLTHANIRQDGVEDLFWPKFVGQLGRCGWTEKPPNTTVNYDYHDNYDPVPSDVADWSPEGIGVKTPVSASTWGEHAYPWPLGTGLPGAWERNEAHWYIYWMQSMPGRGNTIPFGMDGMENWWRLTANWDGSIKAGAGLEVSHLKPISLGTARDAVRTLKGQLSALVSSGRLSAADGNSLQDALDSAARLLDSGQMQPAADFIRRFRHRIRLLVESGRVVPRDVRTLQAGTRWLIDRMEAS